MSKKVQLHPKLEAALQNTVNANWGFLGSAWALIEAAGLGESVLNADVTRLTDDLIAIGQEDSKPEPKEAARILHARIGGLRNVRSYLDTLAAVAQ